MKIIDNTQKRNARSDRAIYNISHKKKSDTGISNTPKIALLSITASLLLAGCFNNSNNDGNASSSSSTKLATQWADSEPGSIDNAKWLKDDINHLFGNPDDDPVDIEDGEKLADIFDKAGS